MIHDPVDRLADGHFDSKPFRQGGDGAGGEDAFGDGVAFFQDIVQLPAFAQGRALVAAVNATLALVREQGLGAVHPSAESEDAWSAEVDALANATLFPRTESWWTGANVPGKPRYFSAYLGGSIYYQRIADIAAQDYQGFEFEKPGAEAASEDT